MKEAGQYDHPLYVYDYVPELDTGEIFLVDVYTSQILIHVSSEAILSFSLGTNSYTTKPLYPVANKAFITAG